MVDRIVSTGYVPANGSTVNLRECELCGGLYALQAAHAEGTQATATAVMTERHKAKLRPGK